MRVGGRKNSREVGRVEGRENGREVHVGRMESWSYTALVFSFLAALEESQRGPHRRRNMSQCYYHNKKH